MTLANRFNFLLHLCIAISAFAFVTADHKPLLAILAALGVGVSWALSRGARVDRPPTLARGGINLLVLAAIINATLRAFHDQLEDPFVSTLGQFLLFLVLIKLLDRRSPRDDAQIITLAIFIAVAAVLTSNSFLVGLLLIVFVPLAVAASMLWQIRAGQVLAINHRREQTPAGGPGAASLGPPGLVLPAGPHARRGFIVLCLTSVLASSVIATVVFVVMPRGLGSEFLGRFGIAHQTEIGFSETVHLGESGTLQENQAPVLDIQITSENGQTIGGPGELFYLRGAARDHYDPSHADWDDASSSAGEARSGGETIERGYAWMLPHMEGYSSPGTPSSSRMAASTRRVQRVTMRGDSIGGNMFCLWRPLSITFDHATQAAFSSRFGTVRHTTPVGPNFTYTVVSQTTDDLSHSPPPVTDFQSGPIREFTDLLLKQRGMGRDKPNRNCRQMINAIRDYLRSKYAYTTEMVAPPPNVDPIEFFLFDRQKGHCEYFASAMAAMCQSQGVPCRVVTGYLASEFNSITGSYTVRRSSAHAWVEAFVSVDQGLGRWEPVDPSPQADIERLHKPAEGVLARLRNWYEALEFGWSTSVVGFDNAGERRETGASRHAIPDETAFSPRLTTLLSHFALWAKSVRSDPSRIPLWVRALPLLGVIVVAVSVAGRRFRSRYSAIRNTSRARTALGMSPLRAPGFYGRALRALARAGVPKPGNTPPARFADALALQSPAAAGHLRSIASALYDSRFGSRKLTPAQLADADAEVGLLRDALREMKTRARPRADDEGGRV